MKQYKCKGFISIRFFSFDDKKMKKTIDCRVSGISKFFELIASKCIIVISKLVLQRKTRKWLLGKGRLGSGKCKTEK